MEEGKPLQIGEMSSQDAGNHQFQGVQDVKPPEEEEAAAADRRDRRAAVAAADEALAHELRMADLMELEDLGVLAMGEGARENHSVGVVDFMASIMNAHDFFRGAPPAAAREEALHRHAVPPPAASSGFRRPALLRPGGQAVPGASSSRTHPSEPTKNIHRHFAVASPASPAIAGAAGTVRTVLSLALHNAAPVVSPVHMLSRGDRRISAPSQNLPAGAAASRAADDFSGDIFPAGMSGLAAAALETPERIIHRGSPVSPAKAQPKPQPKIAGGNTPAVVAGKGKGHSNVWEEEDPLCSKRWDVLANRNTPIIIAGMEEGHDNAWYDSIIHHNTIEEKEEDPEPHEPFLHFLQDLPPRSETPDMVAAAAVSVEEGGEISLPKFYKKWGVGPSDLDREDTDSSANSLPRVQPLADGDLPVFDCGICFETLPLLDLFRGLLCEHRFCLECMTTYVEGKVREGVVPIQCPDPECRDEEDGVLQPEHCKKAIDFAAFSNWGLRLAEGAISHNRRSYCPNRRCGIMLETSGKEKPAQAACRECSLLLCAVCGMEWANGGGGKHDCARSPDNAIMRKLADEKRWKQCPGCKMMVERIAGCRVMHCRCHMVFCYRCGLQMGQVLVGSEICHCTDFILGHLNDFLADPGHLNDFMAE